MEPRWILRFTNFAAALARLEEALAEKQVTMLEKDGTIKRFEFTFELAWKLLKDILEEAGYDVTSPKDVIKKAAEVGLIQNADSWLSIIDSRNITAHEYDESKSNVVYDLVAGKFVHLLRDLKLAATKKREKEH